MMFVAGVVAKTNKEGKDVSGVGSDKEIREKELLSNP